MEADTLLLTVPNQLSVGYNADVNEPILKIVAPPFAGADRKSNSDQVDFDA